MKSYQIIFVLLTISAFLSSIQAALKNNEQKLREYIFQNYSADVRPVTNATQAILVLLSYEFMQIVSVEERNQLISVRLWLRMRWTNELLSWNPSEWSGIDQIKVKPDQIWKPDIIVYNHVNQKGHEMLTDNMDDYRALISVSSDGSNYWIIRLMSTTSCQINVTYFPFDEQVCTLKFGSWGYSSKELALEKFDDPSMTKYYVGSSEWTLTYIRDVLQEEMFQKKFSTLSVNFSMVRKYLYYMLNIVVPCIILMLLILISFCLPPNSGERVGVIVTVLLAFTVFLHIVQNILPATSTSVPLLALFYVIIMAEGAIALLVTCIVIVAQHQKYVKGVKPLPQWIRKFVLTGFGEKFRRKSVIARMIRSSLPTTFSTIVEAKAMRSCEVDNGVDECNHGSENRPIASMHNATSNADADNVNVNLVRGEIDEKECEIAEQWHMLSQILDRMFFWVILLTFLITSIAILVPAATSRYRDKKVLAHV